MKKTEQDPDLRVHILSKQWQFLNIIPTEIRFVLESLLAVQKMYTSC